jgi:hypothetical protein
MDLFFQNTPRTSWKAEEEQSLASPVQAPAVSAKFYLYLD